MGEHSRDKVYYGAEIARGEDDQGIGFQAYRMERGVEKGQGTKTIVGEVRPTIAAATKDAWEMFDAEFPPGTLPPIIQVTDQEYAE